MKRTLSFLALLTAVTLTGCASDYEQISPTGIVALHGVEPMTLQAPSDGQLSIYNQSEESLLYSGLIHKGDLLVIDPATKKVTLNGLVANAKPLYGGDSLKIDFSANP